MDIKDANRKAWNWEASNRSAWAEIADEESIRRAREGSPDIRVTISRNVPLSWVGDLRGKRILTLGGGGGQQTPILAAAGADVTVVDISDQMIARDREALGRYGLKAALIQGDMEAIDFEDSFFDGVISPVSMNFIENIGKVFSKVCRALKEGGFFIFGIANPALYIFDDRKLLKGKMKIKYTLPFSDTKSLSEKELLRRVAANDTVEYSHTLDTILGGLTEEGFAVTGFFSNGSGFEPIDSYLQDCYLAIMARKISLY